MTLPIPTHPLPPRPLSACGHACPLCGGEAVSVKYRIAEHQIRRCDRCTFMWLFPQPSIDDLRAVYDVSYFDNQGFFSGDSSDIYGYYDYVAERFNRQAEWRPVLHDIRSRLNEFRPGASRLLDIGCGPGYLLDVAHDEGFRVSGVEFNESAARHLSEKYVFPVYTGPLADYADGPFDVVTMMDVIEHLWNPVADVATVHGLLREGGLFALVTMDSDSWVSRLLGARLEDFRRVREHLSFPTRASIRFLLESAGFEILSIRSYGHTFPLAFLADRLRLVSPLVGKTFSALVQALGIGALQVHLNPRTKMLIIARKRTALAE